MRIGAPVSPDKSGFAGSLRSFAISLGSMPVRLLVVQPSATDPPDRLADWLTEADAELRLLDPAVEPVAPTPESWDGVVCLGGDMGAGDDSEHPWLAEIRALLAAAVTAGTPVLGICLGAQLLAVATGGAVRRGVDGPAAGAVLVAKRDAAAGDPLLAEAPLTPAVLQFHHDEIHQLPPGAVLLASAPGYPHQAFRVGAAAYGLQFHIETTPERVLEWAREDPVAAAAAPPGQLEPEYLRRLHDELAETWRPVAHRFVRFAAQHRDLEPTRDPGPAAGTRPTLPLLGEQQ